VIDADHWHRVFHPLCGSDLRTLLVLLARNGAPSRRGLPRLTIALACAICRLPFTAAERAFLACAPKRPGLPPVFIVGHMRSGTTHLHNLLHASGQFATVPPVLAGMPWEALGLARLLRPFIDDYLPQNRLIDEVRVESDSPTEDEVAIANMLPVSFYHAIYFPTHFERNYRAGLLPGDAEEAAWERTLAHYVHKMSMLRPERPLLLKNPAYTARIERLRRLWPEARFIHIYRNPYVVFESARAALGRVLRELALQDSVRVPLEEIVLETYPRMMDQLLQQAARVPADAIAHVRFENLEADPKRELERVYATLWLDDFATVWPRIEAYLDGIHDYRKANHRFEPDAVGKVSKRWGRFVAHWRYEPPLAAH
jgi:omega-hydroxy-beta-dihydromenaquinone-9 sulfotransferase